MVASSSHRSWSKSFSSCWVVKVICALAIISGFASAAGTTTYHDAATGFTFGQYSATYKYNNPEVFTVRIAVPRNATPPYDVVLQIVCPNDIGWFGVAWGGGMLDNPLTVSWRDGNKATVSSRRTSTRSLPQPYNGETLQVLSHGTSVNTSSWQVSMICTGCTSWNASSGSTQSLNPTAINTLAFAYSASAPATPSSNTSAFAVHDLYGTWNHDFSMGENADFPALVAKNT